MGQKFPVRAWAVKHRSTNKLVIFDARCPVYWLQRIAKEEAQKRGLTTEGAHSSVIICRVVVKERG